MKRERLTIALVFVGSVAQLSHMAVQQFLASEQTAAWASNTFKQTFMREAFDANSCCSTGNLHSCDESDLSNFFVSSCVLHDPTDLGQIADETTAGNPPPDVFDARSFGAIGNDRYRSAFKTLGVTTLADLANYRVNGRAPYRFVASYPFGTLFNLPVSRTTLRGSAILHFGTTQASGSSPLLATAAAARGATILSVAPDPNLNADFDGCSFSGQNVAPGTVGTFAPGVVRLSHGLVAANGANTVISAACTHGYQVYLANIDGINQGQTISGNECIQPVTQVDYVNPATGAIRLSKPTLCKLFAGSTLSFRHSWVSKVTKGMLVSGPGIPAKATVLEVDTATGDVTLSNVLTSAVYPVSSNDAKMAHAHSTEITFYAPYTDSQAIALSMDGLGINAAIQAASRSGGKVQMPSGRYLSNMPIIMPLTSSVSLAGAQEQSTVVRATDDLGPGIYLLSCGDPSATADNQRGIYENGGTFCNGEWSDFSIMTGAASSIGRRPLLAGVPIAMSGMRQGPRRNMRRVAISGFNKGIEFQGDWTQWNYVASLNNFIGFRLGDPMTLLFDDLNFSNTFFGGNAFAGISIAPTAQLQAQWTKSWLANQPYEIWFEPGTGGGIAITDTLFQQINFEGTGCGLLIDGNTDTSTKGQLRGVSNVTVDQSNVFRDESKQLPEGCPWTAYYDMSFAYGLSVTHVPAATNYPPVHGGVSLARLHTVSSSPNNGGFLFSGPQAQLIVQNYAALGQEFVTEQNAANGTLGDMSALISIENPGQWYGHVFLYTDPAMRTVTLGALLEASAASRHFSVERGGTPALRPVIGVSMADYSASNMISKFVVVGTRGLLPVAVHSSQKVGTQIKVTGFQGQAGAASVPTGVVVNNNSGLKSIVYCYCTFGP